MALQHTPDAAVPLDYQRQDARDVFRVLGAGESCALVGVGSVGKSSFLRFITRTDVKQHYLGEQEGARLITVLLNPHHLIHLQDQALAESGSVWPGYELMLSRLRRTLSSMVAQGALPLAAAGQRALLDMVSQCYGMLFDDRALLRQTGIRQLEDAVLEVVRASEHLRLVFMFDEFEAFAHLPPQFFQSLRGLRDDFKQRVIFLTASRTPLDALAQAAHPSAPEQQALEGFIELFYGFTHHMRLLDDDSAVFSVRRLENRNRLERIAPVLERELLRTTGGHAGLLRRAFLPATRVAVPENVDRPSFIDYLLADSGVQQECRAMLASLTPAEQRLLLEIATQRQTVADDNPVWRALLDKHLVGRRADGTAALTIPVFAMFLLRA